MTKLVLIGGAPGVGKSTVLQHLPDLFERCAWLDADDVWRVRPQEWKPEFEGNVVAVLRGYLEAGYPTVFLSWVLADPAKVERILSALEGLYDEALVVYLTASPEVLELRSRNKISRGLAPEYQAFKAEQIAALPCARIDTSGLAPPEVATAIASFVRSGDRTREGPKG